VELGDEAKYALKGEGTNTFQLELGNSLDAKDALYVPILKKNFLSVLAMEDMGLSINFWRGKLVIRPKKANLDTTMVIEICWHVVGRLDVNHQYTNKTLRHRPFRHNLQESVVSLEAYRGAVGTKVLQ
jgi:hypothetical protein